MDTENRTWDSLSESVQAIIQSLRGVTVYGVTFHVWGMHDLKAIGWASVRIEGRVDDLGSTFDSLQGLKGVKSFEVRPYGDWQQLVLSLEIGHKPPEGSVQPTEADDKEE